MKIITNNVSSQPKLDGVCTEFVEYNLETFDREIQEFDIGICPVIKDFEQLSNPSKFIRNANRVNTLLFYGIPSVTSPIPQTCQYLKDGETTLYAVTEEGWYLALRSLITQPGLRQIRLVKLVEKW